MLKHSVRRSFLQRAFIALISVIDRMQEKLTTPTITKPLEPPRFSINPE
ncbi:hypothetical protein [Alkanindiges illinoisensis]|nr:hypothetical protein [Alkanindiges illinoisensis]